MQIITTHRNTDFDALASVVAANLLYPDAIPVLPRSINPNVKAFLSIHKDIYNFYKADQVDNEKIESLIVVDTNKWNRLPRRLHNIRQRETIQIMLWDHHDNHGDIISNNKCVEELGANITLMIRKIKEKNIQLSPIQSTLFLIGLYEDTGHLTFSSSTSEDAYSAGFLLEQRADLNILGSFLSPAYGQKQKDILFHMLKSSTRKNVNGFEISFNTQTIQGHVDRLSVVVQMYREIINVDAAFGIFMRDAGKCIVIGRSNTDDLNIGRIMQSIGGGGHPGAGSAMLSVKNTDTVEEMITTLIEGNQQSSVKIADLMSFPVLTVNPDTPMFEIENILNKKGCSGLPVVENDEMVGIISKRDLEKLKKKSQWNAPVKAFMRKNIKTISPGKSPMQAARMMVKHDIGRLPVIEEGKIIGIVTRSDAMVYFYDLLPK